MRITIAKERDIDRLDIQRGDGSRATTSFPKKGPIPHDFVHFAVERGLGLADAFWGKVAKGEHPEALGEMAKMGGHSSAKRAQEPDPAIVEMVQSERLVECFEADLWSGGGDNGSLRHMAEAGWAQSCVPPLAMTDEELDRIRTRILDFADDWRALPVGGTVTLDWNPAE